MKKIFSFLSALLFLAGCGSEVAEDKDPLLQRLEETTNKFLDKATQSLDNAYNQSQETLKNFQEKADNLLQNGDNITQNFKDKAREGANNLLDSLDQMLEDSPETQQKEKINSGEVSNI